MKLLITIVQAYDSDRLLRAITSSGLSATRINSTGGFLRMANSTILMAVSDERLPEAIELVRSIAKRRIEVKMDATAAEYSDLFAGGFHEVSIGGAVIFMMQMDGLYKIFPDRIERYDKAPA